MVKEHNIGHLFIVMASVVVVLGGVKIASSIVVPLLLSMFIAIIFAPMYLWLNSKKIPEGISLLLVVSLFLILVGLLGALVGSSVQDFTASMPQYEQRLTLQLDGLFNFLEGFGITVPEQEFSEMFNPNIMMKFAAGLLQSLGGVFANGLVILFTVVFMLLESSQFARKIDHVDGDKDSIHHIKMVVDKIKHYMVLKTIISIATGVVVTIMLMIVGVDYPILWGVVAFMLNFIPNIGSLIAAVPAVLLTLIQISPLSALLVSIGYIVINVVIGSVVEPKVMGKGLGLSTLVVFLSLIFWGWLLGSVGMLLSIPLTIMAKIVLDAQEDTRWIAVLLGEDK